MENVKMEKQRTSAPYPQIMGRILRQGLAGYWAGFWPWGFVLGVSKGTVLGGSRAVLLDLFEHKLHMSKAHADLASGFGAGAVQGIAMSPILLARTRVNQSLAERAAAASAAGGRIQTGLWAEMVMSTKVLNAAIHQEGVGVLGKGMPAMVVKRAFDWGTRFIFINMFRDWYGQSQGLPAGTVRKGSALEELTISFLGGAASCAVTMPIDRMMPILQQASGDKQGVLAFLSQKMKAEGVGTLQRGFLMRACHTGYHTAWATFGADQIIKLVQRNS